MYRAAGGRNRNRWDPSGRGGRSDDRGRQDSAGGGGGFLVSRRRRARERRVGGRFRRPGRCSEYDRRHAALSRQWLPWRCTSPAAAWLQADSLATSTASVPLLSDVLGVLRRSDPASRSTTRSVDGVSACLALQPVYERWARPRTLRPAHGSDAAVFEMRGDRRRGRLQLVDQYGCAIALFGVER